MPSKVTLYHNPRCSKSRATLELFKSYEIDVTVVEYLKEPPSRETLQSILALLNMQPAQLLRQGESLYKELNLGAGDHSHAEIINAMIENPILIERPIITTADTAVIGRPLDNVIELLDEL